MNYTFLIKIWNYIPTGIISPSIGFFCHVFFVNPPEMGHLLLFQAESVSPSTLLPRLSSTLLKEEKTDVGTLSKFSTNMVKKTDSLRI